MSGLSTVVKNKTLEDLTGTTPYAPSSPLYLALTILAVVPSDTGATLTEPSYTGYARKAVASTDWSAASAGVKTNSNPLVFAACTAGSSIIIGWALTTTASGAGDIIAYGTCTSTTISTTQTPATVPVGQLSVQFA